MEHFIASFGDRSWLFSLFVFVVLCARYVIISGAPYLLAWRIFSDKLAHRKIQTEKQKHLHIKSEVLWSLVSFTVFSIEAGIIHSLYIHGHTSLTMSWDSMPAYVHIIEFFSLLIIHDAYFYWSHRTLHHRLLFKYIHATHHKSVNPTPFAAFAFHPGEAFVEMAFLIPIIIWVPLYLGTLIIFLIVSHFFNVIGHLGYEFFPRSTWTSWWGSWNTTSTHHNLHHQQASSNYGLYCKLWDKWGGTLNPRTEPEFFRVADLVDAKRDKKQPPNGL